MSYEEEEDYGPAFCIMEGATFFRRKKEWALFEDFYLGIMGEIADGGFLVCSFGARVLGRLTERYDYSVESSFLEFGWCLCTLYFAEALHLPCRLPALLQALCSIVGKIRLHLNELK